MLDAITDVHGILVGHAQDREGATGCTVILCGEGAVAGVDVRGGAPGTRETACLDPSNTVQQVQGVLLAGGSAFGLDAATGVVRWLEEHGLGFDAAVARVPVVPAAVIFDLTVGSPSRRPDAAMGYEACGAAGAGAPARGNVGAGTGAAVGPKLPQAGPGRLMKSGIGTASRRVGRLVVGAIAAVNCFGDIVDPATGEVIGGALAEGGDGFAGAMALLEATQGQADTISSNTTIAVVATNARLDKAQARRVAIMAHDGLARTIVPVHTPTDGDTIFALATGEVAANLGLVGALASEAVARSVLDAVRSAGSAYGLPGCREVQERMARRGDAGRGQAGQSKGARPS